MTGRTDASDSKEPEALLLTLAVFVNKNGEVSITIQHVTVRHICRAFVHFPVGKI